MTPHPQPMQRWFTWESNPNQYSSPIDCIKHSRCPTKEADHSKVGALGGVNIGKVDCTDQDYTRTMSSYQPCPLLDRLEECSVLDPGEG